MEGFRRPKEEEEWRILESHRRQSEGTNSSTNATVALPSTSSAPTLAAAAAAAVLRNPYATGKSSSTVTRHHHKSSAPSSNGLTTATATTGPTIETKAPAPRTTAPRTAPNHVDRLTKNQQQQQQQQQELAHWERLPSRNVSFTSAEVLTVSECLRDGHSIAGLYFEEGRSVRVTGILDRRSVRPTNEPWEVVAMEVRDPVSVATTAKSKAKPTPKRADRGRGSALLGSKRPSAIPKSGHTGIAPRDDEKRIRRRKRPWFASGGATSHTKHPSSVEASKKASTAAPPSTATTTLRVIVDPRGVPGATSSLAAAVVGSFVTVIGEFASIAATPEKGGRPVPYELEARTLRVINHHHHEFGDASAASSANANATTDMVLYQKALLLRRRSMYERYHYASSSSSSSHQHPDKGSMRLLQGCGPPPYDALRRALQEDGERNGQHAKHPV